jgi:hypothetical protein
MNIDPLAIALKQYAKICKTHRVNVNWKLDFKHKLVSYYMNSLAQLQRSQAAGCDKDTHSQTAGDTGIADFILQRPCVCSVAHLLKWRRHVLFRT